MKHNYNSVLTRLLSIIQRLYEGETLNKKDLSVEFNVSQKTIQRDFNERLLNYQVIFIRGLGWKFDKNYLNKYIAQKYSRLFEEEKYIKTLELNILDAQEAIDNAEAIIITAGAGLGVDSGLPDFRGNDGFWIEYPPLQELGLQFHDMANPKWFDTNPNTAWGFYGHRLNLYRATKPHNGFEILKKLVQLKANNYFIFTSNVDGQFQQAGFDEDKIVEVHGSIHHNQCVETCNNEIWSNKNIDVIVNTTTFLASQSLPKCINCNKLARPNIMMFGDYGFNHHRVNAQEIRLQYWLKENISNNVKLVVIEIGAGKDIPTVRNYSDEIMSQYGADLIRINPRDFDGKDKTISIALGAKEALEKIYS